MTDREEANCRGPVREVFLERGSTPSATLDWWEYSPGGHLIRLGHRNPDGTEWQSEYRYDEHGERIDPKPPAKIPAAGGGWSEMVEIPVTKNAFWSALRGLHGFGFTIGAATRATKRYDARGVPVEVVFEDADGQATSRLELRADEQGRIVEALQYSGAKPDIHLSRFEKAMLSAEDTAKIAGLLDPGGLRSRVCFEYDADGRLVAAEQFLGGMLAGRTAYTYNEHGDMASETHEGTQTARFEYEYDAWGNWTKQIVHHVGGAEESRRRITYHESAGA